MRNVEIEGEKLCGKRLNIKQGKIENFEDLQG